MKRVLFVIAICAVQAFPQGKSASASRELAHHECRNSSDETALRRIADRWKEAYNAGDSAKIASLYTEDAYYLTQHFAGGILHGRNRIMAYFKMGTDAGFRMDKIDVIETACSGDFGYAISRYESTNAGQKAFGVIC